MCIVGPQGSVDPFENEVHPLCFSVLYFFPVKGHGEGKREGEPDGEHWVYFILGTRGWVGKILFRLLIVITHHAALLSLGSKASLQTHTRT